MNEKDIRFLLKVLHSIRETIPKGNIEADAMLLKMLKKPLDQDETTLLNSGFSNSEIELLQYIRPVTDFGRNDIVSLIGLLPDYLNLISNTFTGKLTFSQCIKLKNVVENCEPDSPLLKVLDIKYKDKNRLSECLRQMSDEINTSNDLIAFEKLVLVLIGFYDQ